MEKISPGNLLKESGLDKERAERVIHSLRGLGLLQHFARQGRRSRWVIETEFRGIGPDGVKYHAEDLDGGWALPDVQGSAEASEIPAENSEFYIGPRPPRQKQDDRHIVLTKAHKALIHIIDTSPGVTEITEDGRMIFVTSESVTKKIEELTQVHPRQVHSILRSLRGIDLVRIERLTGPGVANLYRWSVSILEGEITVEQVELSRQAVRVERIQEIADDAGRVGVKPLTEVVPGETLTPEDSPGIQVAESEAPETSETSESLDINEVLSRLGERLEALAAEVTALRAERANDKQTISIQRSDITRLQSELDAKIAELEQAQKSKLSVEELPDSVRKFL